MSDQNEEWWNDPSASDATPPAPGRPATPAPSESDADTTVVVPRGGYAGGAEHAGAPIPPPGAPDQPPPPPAPPSAQGRYGQPGYQPGGYQQPGAPQPGYPQASYQQPGNPQAQYPPAGPPPAFVPGYSPVGGASATGKRRATAGAIVMLAGVLLAAVGTLLPWIGVDGFDPGDLPNGFDRFPFGDTFDPTIWSNPGAYVLGAMALVALVAIIVLATGKSSALSVLGIVSSVIGGLVAVAALAVVGSIIGDSQDVFQFGPGILVVALGAVVAFVGSILVAVKH